MHRSTWKEEYRLGKFRQVIGHRSLSAWRDLINKADQSDGFGFLCLFAGVAMLILIAAIAEAW